MRELPETKMSNAWIIGLTTVGCSIVFWFWHQLLASNNHDLHYYFDAQDVDQKRYPDRTYPKSVNGGTFAPLLKHYISLTKLLVTLAAASITFGGGQSTAGIFAAKLVLAYSIMFGVLFCASVLYRYEEYTQNAHSYTRGWYCTVEALFFSTLTAFFVGYVFWAMCLRPGQPR